MNNKMTVNPILVKFLLVFGLVTLYILGLNFFIAQITKTTQEMSIQRSTIQSLRQKASALSSAGSEVTQFADGVLIAIPQSDSSLLGMSQIKTVASSAGLIIDNISYGSETKMGEDLNKVNFGIDLSGNVESFKSFLEILKSSAPISTINNLRLSQEASTGRLSLSVSFYWGPLPTKLPELEKPLVNLTSEDMQLVSDLANLTKPVVNVSVGSTPATDSGTIITGRQNIFELPSE